MLKTVRESPEVSETIKDAAKIYPRTWEAFEGLCWLLARGMGSNVPASGDQSLYYLHRQAAGGFGVPGFTVIYSMTDETIDLHAIRVT